MKKPYLKPQISVIMIEPQAILAGSDPANAGITYDGKIGSGEEEEVWD